MTPAPGPENSLLFEHNPEPVFLFDVESLKIMDVNRVASEVYGYSKEEFRTLTIADIRPPERIGEMQQFFDRGAIRTGNIGVWEHMNRNGERFYVEIHSEEFVREGRLIRLALVKRLDHLNRDEVITHAARYEIQYHLEHTSLGVIQWNDKARIQYISDRISEFVGLPTEKLIGISVEEFTGLIIRDENHDVVLSGFLDLVEGHVARNTINVRIERKDGQSGIFRSFNSALHDREKRLISILTIVENLTEMERARERLQQQELMFSHLFENSPVGLVQIDTRGRIVRTNPGFRQIFGYIEPELTGVVLDELIIPAELKLSAGGASSLQKGVLGKLQAESVRLHRDGRRIPVLIGSVPIYIGSRKVAAFAMYIDISDRKQQEQELIESLEEKQVLLQEIHHRVKNNLAVVSGLLEIQAISLTNPDAQKALKDSQLRLKSMALIHEKLYESGQLTRIELNRVLQDLVSLTRQALDPDHRIRITLHAEKMRMNINQAMPATLIINELVGNAFEHAFGDNDIGEIEIRLHRSGNRVSVDIRDNGRGFPAGVLTGEADSMGFTIVHTLIGQLDADLEIRNDNGGHVRFTFQAEHIRGSSSALPE